MAAAESLKLIYPGMVCFVCACVCAFVYVHVCVHVCVCVFFVSI